jgi:TP901 family phage tail tape measure protein
MAIGPVDIEFIVKGDIDRQLQKVGRTVKGESAEMTQQMTRLKKESFSLDKQFSAIGQTVKTMLPIASFTAAALALKNLTTEAYNFSKDFSKAMREVETISTAVKANFEGISKEITNVAANGPDDAIRLAQAYYQIVSAGHDGAAGLELLKVSSKAATAGVTDTKIAADGLTTVLNAWGKDASQATKVADVLFKTVEKGKTTFPELAQTIAQVAPMAAAMGIPLEEIAAAIASIQNRVHPPPRQ